MAASGSVSVSIESSNHYGAESTSQYERVHINTADRCYSSQRNAAWMRATHWNMIVDDCNRTSSWCLNLIIWGQKISALLLVRKDMRICPLWHSTRSSDTTLSVGWFADLVPPLRLVFSMDTDTLLRMFGKVQLRGRSFYAFSLSVCLALHATRAYMATESGTTVISAFPFIMKSDGGGHLSTGSSLA